MVWPLPRFVFIGERAADTLRSARLSGMSIRPVGELDIPAGTLTHGRLSYWMPEVRARQLGEQFGIS